MRGRMTNDVRLYKHDELDVFGCKDDVDEKVLNAVLRQAIIAGYITRDIENYGLLKVTDIGKSFIDNPISFKIVEDRDFTDDDNEINIKNGTTSAVDPVLFSMLKDLRKQIARKLGLPPYVIFQDPSLEAMATTYPINLDELQKIPGVGAGGKAKRYGDEFIDLIKRHVEENEIERPDDLWVRTVPNKSKPRLAIIQGIDRKTPLNELARSRGIEFSEILDEIETIVNSGTKINIDYYLEDIMDEEDIEEIVDYFKDSESDDLKSAMEELGDVYSEDEIRMVRIKFMSEMGI